MRFWYFIAYAYSCSLNMHEHEASMTRGLFFCFCHGPLSTPSLCGGGGAVKVLARLSACTAVSKHWRPFGCTICT